MNSLYDLKSISYHLAISGYQLKRDGGLTMTLKLTENEQKMLDGDFGKGAQLAMKIQASILKHQYQHSCSLVQTSFPF